MAELPDFIRDMQPCSYKGVTFGLQGVTLSGSRRQQPHTYPFSDSTWVQDMGRNPGAITVRGFVLSASEAALVYALEADRGPGEFVPPNGDSFEANLLTISVGQSVDTGNMYEIQMTLLRNDGPQRTSSVSTLSSLASIAGQANSTFGDSFLGSIKSTITSGTTAVLDARRTLDGYVQVGRNALNDVARTYNSVRGIGKVLGINMGRFDGGSITKAYQAIGQINGNLSAVGRAAQGVNNMLAFATRTRQAALTAADRVSTWIGKL